MHKNRLLIHGIYIDEAVSYTHLDVYKRQGLTVWLWIIFVVNVLAAIGGIVVALGASVVGAALGLGSI